MAVFMAAAAAHAVCTTLWGIVPQPYFTFGGYDGPYDSNNLEVGVPPERRRH